VTGTKWVLYPSKEISTQAFFQNLGQLGPGHLIPPGIWTLADVIEYGRENVVCPYFLVRRMVNLSKLMKPMLAFSTYRFQMPFVDVIIYSFHYLLDPKVAEQVSKELSKDAIVVFDEAHNIGMDFFSIKLRCLISFPKTTYASSP
jgi:Rad3-related DNA helicase